MIAAGEAALAVSAADESFQWSGDGFVVFAGV
jgi:hypothetical protein